MKRFLFPSSVLFLLITCSSLGCNSGSSSSGSTAADGFPSGMAIASPTAQGSNGAATISQPGVLLFHAESFSSDGSFADKAEAYEAIVDATSNSACQISLPPFNAGTNPTCYGPTLDYQDHADAAPNTDGSLPSGDLGIWSEEQVSGEACTAAKINSLITNAANYADYVMHLSASFVCRLERAGTSLPTIDGAIVDLTEDLNAAIQVHNPTVTVTTATVENLVDVVDTDTVERDVWEYVIVVTDTAGPHTTTMTAHMKHMLTADGYKGKMWMEREGSPNVGDKSAVSVSYEKSTSLKIKMLTADYQSVVSPEVFTEDGDLAIDGDWTGNITQTILNVDATTGFGNFSFSWQAGVGDSHSRTFNGFTQSGSACGFFGFGQKFDKVGNTASDNVIDGMICNWAGPNGNHNMTSTAHLAQKQCMTFNSGTGLFEVDSSKNKIAFAPTNSCNGDGVMTVRTGSDPYTPAVTSNELVNLTTDLDFADYSAPTTPDLPSGF